MKDQTWALWMKVGRLLGCHQKPERSFFIRGCQFPICARCTGVLIGYAVCFLTVGIYRPPWWLIGCCLILMAADWGLQFLKIKKSTNVRRFMTGILGGYGWMMLFLRLLFWFITLLWPR